jgi:hypothetical protein
MRGGIRRVAQIPVAAQFAALIRCLAEYFRLEYFAPQRFSLARVEPFLLGAVVSAVLAFVGVLFYFGENYKTTVAVAALNVGILLILRFTLL